MKKLLVGLFVFGLLAMGSSQVHASTLSDALLKIQNLKNEITQLRSSLGASAGLADLPADAYKYKVAFWPGKVNQHMDIASNTWATDPDGSSGSGVDKLTYCRKFYPGTTSVVEYTTETFGGWQNQGNFGNYTGTNMTYICVPPSYTVTGTAGAGGTITPASQTVVSGGKATFTIKPNTGYRINSNSYSSGCPGTGHSFVGSMETGGTYTIPSITKANCNITSEFVSTTPVSYTVKGTATAGGTITPASQSVVSGGKATFTIKPNTGYRINSNSYSSGCPGTGHSFVGSMETGGTYTISSITKADCNITSEFVSTTPVCPQLSAPGPDYCPNGTVKVTTGSTGCPSYECVPNTTPSITILSPNGGEVYQAGQQITVKWKSTGVPSDYYVIIQLMDDVSKIDYKDNGRQLRTINDGQETFSIPVDDSDGTKLISGKRYKIGMWSGMNEGSINISSDWSDNLFTINQANNVCTNGNTNYPDCTTNNDPYKITPTTDQTPRISVWSGKVNQHVSVSEQMWQTDSDGVSGSGLDKLAYCKKFYPNTTSVSEYKMETINSWHDRGNINSYKGTNMSYQCVQNATTPSITVLSPNGGEVYQAGQQITVKWNSNSLSSTKDLFVDLHLDKELFHVVYLSESTLNDGIEVFTFPNNIQGGSYRIRIGSADASIKQDWSDNYFTINSSTTTDGCLDGGIYSDTTGLKCYGVPTNDSTPRISVWPGKVNQHVNIVQPGGLSATWATDPDGVTGSGVDKLAYCKKFYPNTTSVQEYKTETFWGWRDRGNVSNYKGINMTYKCVEGSITTTNTPVISGVSGPQTLKVGQTGTWTVKASSPMGGNLSYSVVWGDEKYQASTTSSTNPTQNTQQSATFTHSYSGDGIFTPVFTVKSENTIRCVTTPCPSNEGIASTSLSVTVGQLPVVGLPAGCTSTSGYSPITGVRCDGNINNDGCKPGFNFSPITGAKCVDIIRTCSSSGAGCGNTKTDPSTTSTTGNTSITRTLKKGISGEDVKILQAFLNLAIDGKFGPATQQKVMEWQAANGLKVDGAFGIQSATKAGLSN